MKRLERVIWIKYKEDTFQDQLADYLGGLISSLPTPENLIKEKPKILS